MSEAEPISVEEVRAILSGPPSIVGYHGTKALSEVLRNGLRVDRVRLRCRHVCLSPTPELAAMFAFGDDAGVLRVDLGELGVPPFVGNEARSHVDISPDRLAVVDGEIVPTLEGHIDPAKAYGPVRNHPHCWPYLRSGRELLGLPPLSNHLR
jgi:hypothetical protein